MTRFSRWVISPFSGDNVSAVTYPSLSHILAEDALFHDSVNTWHIAGGDDVQQLCDAGEEEFLEIMALVGMASKPLHVRRLQKALQEWLTNPCKVSPVCHESWRFYQLSCSSLLLTCAALFQTPVVPANATAAKSSSAVSFACASPRPQMQSLPTGFTAASQPTLTPAPYISTAPHVPLTPLPCRSVSPVVPATSVSASASSTTFRQSPSPNTSLPYATTHSPSVLQVKVVLAIRREEIEGKGSDHGGSD
jgi:hypothetical protein